jgi:modulator of FtsH protease HflC
MVFEKLQNYRRVLGDANMAEIVRDNRADLTRRWTRKAASSASPPSMWESAAPDLSRQISKKVFSRMQSGRAREAAEYRAKGSETARTITATADRDVVVLRGNAQRQADQTRDEGDAERNRIFAEACGQDPDFLAFYRSMQAFETGLKGSDTRMVMSPKSDFFRFFGTPNGQPATPAAVAPTASR